MTLLRSCLIGAMSACLAVSSIVVFFVSMDVFQASMPCGGLYIPNDVRKDTLKSVAVQNLLSQETLASKLRILRVADLLLNNDDLEHEEINSCELHYIVSLISNTSKRTNELSLFAAAQTHLFRHRGDLISTISTYPELFERHCTLENNLSESSVCLLASNITR